MADKDWAREDTRALALFLNASADEQRSGGARLLIQRCRRSPAHTAPGQRSDLAFVRPARPAMIGVIQESPLRWRAEPRRAN